MKILLVTGSFPPEKCGVGDYSFSLAKALADEPNVHVAILTSTSCGEGGVHEGIEIFPVLDKWRLAELPKVVKAIRKWSPDIVHIQYPTQGYGGGLLPWFLPMIAFVMRRRVVQTWHEGYSWRDAPLLFLKAIVPSQVVVVRPQYKEGLRSLFRWTLSRKKFLYIRNASSVPRVPLDNHERSELKARYLNGQRRLIVYFGFVLPHKGIELLFEIANPSSDRIVLAGETSKGGEYWKRIVAQASVEPWRGQVTIAGFLPPGEVGTLLAVADAVILPFRVGGGEWNTSIHAAVLQGTFVITTSLTRNGYDKQHNVYYAKLDDVQEMKSALDSYAGTRRRYVANIDRDEWQQIASEHRSLYLTHLSE